MRSQTHGHSRILIEVTFALTCRQQRLNSLPCTVAVHDVNARIFAVKGICVHSWEYHVEVDWWCLTIIGDMYTHAAACRRGIALPFERILMGKQTYPWFSIGNDDWQYTCRTTFCARHVWCCCLAAKTISMAPQCFLNHIGFLVESLIYLSTEWRHSPVVV